MLKPMLAGSIEANELVKLSFPVLAQPKLDGIRCIVFPDGSVVSRSLKPIPNKHIQAVLSNLRAPWPVDGEIMLGPNSTFQEITSAVMTEDNEPQFSFHVFDIMTQDKFVDRNQMLLRHFAEGKMPKCALHVPLYVANVPDDILQLQSDFLAKGYEGVILRSLTGEYKHGRSSLRHGSLLKFKNFVDKEYKIIGYEEKLHNANEAKTNALGRTERSSHKENMIPMNTLGCCVVQDLENPDIVFSVGTGWTDESRQHVWDNREKYMGCLLKVKYFEVGMKSETQIPRFPVAMGIRDPRDMSTE